MVPRDLGGEGASLSEVVDICYLFFLAGLDTVTASLDCMLSYLAAHPEQRHQLVQDPAMIPHATASPCVSCRYCSAASIPCPIVWP